MKTKNAGSRNKHINKNKNKIPQKNYQSFRKPV